MRLCNDKKECTYVRIAMFEYGKTLKILVDLRLWRRSTFDLNHRRKKANQ